MMDESSDMEYDGNNDRWDYTDGIVEGDEHDDDHDIESIDYDDYYEEDGDEVREEVEDEEGFHGEIPSQGMRNGGMFFEELLGNLSGNLRRNTDTSTTGSGNNDQVDSPANDRANDTESRAHTHGNIQDLFSMFQNNMFAGAMPGVGNSGRVQRLTKLVDNIENAQSDPYIAMESLRELSEQLLMMNQIVIDRILPIEKLLESLIKIFNDPILQEQLELQLMACRCLHNLFEVDPDSVPVAVEKDIIVCLQAKLQEISYIDLAEQVMETLEYISRIQSKEILEAGNLATYINFFDFFTIHAQRKAISIIANACTKLEIKYFPTVQEVISNIQNIFLQNLDDNIMMKLLNIFYCICGGVNKHFNFDELFTTDTSDKLLNLISSFEIPVENKVKCVEILSILVTKAEPISLDLINSDKIIVMLHKYLASFQKSNNSNDKLLTNDSVAFGETLMSVPDNMLLALSRFFALLLPEEPDNSLTHSTATLEKNCYNNDNLNKILLELIPILVDIYTNSVEYEIRSFIALAILRSVDQMNEKTAESVKNSIIIIFEPFFFKIIETAIGRDGTKTEEYLATELLSTLVALLRKFEKSYLPVIKREGICDYIELLHSKIDYSYIEQLPDMEIDEQDLESNINEDNSDSDIEYGYDDLNIPDYVKPKAIKFEIFKFESLNKAKLGIANMFTSLYQKIQATSIIADDRILENERLLAKIKSIDMNNCNENYWIEIWSEIKAIIFRNGNVISSYELIKSGLLESILYLLSLQNKYLPVVKKLFFQVFESRLEELIVLLQSSLSKSEDVTILECGLQGNEGGIASLSKEIKLQLVYKGDSIKDEIPINLRSVTVSIHSIASLRMLNDFLKHKVAQSMFLTSLLPGFKNENESSDSLISGIKNINFKFSVEDNSCNLNETVFGVIYKDWVRKDNTGNLKGIWLDTPTIFYEKTDIEIVDTENISNNHDSILDPRFDDSSTKQILELLKILQDSSLPKELFINSKISAKLSRQLDEPLIVASGILPSWVLELTCNYPFIFPLDTRIFYLQCSSFGYGRLIERWLDRSGKKKEQSSDNPLQQLGTLTKNKVRLARSCLFTSGLKIIDKYGSTSSTLEVEYQDEEGTGLGPTLEFYSSMSKEFAKSSLNIWRSEIEGSENQVSYVEQELFPKSLLLSPTPDKTLELFRVMGKFIAKAMLDSRILDFRFNELFFQMLHNRASSEDNQNVSLPYSLDMLEQVDLQLSKSLRYLYDNKTNDDLITNLDINFVFPGEKIIELVDSGSDICVTSKNVEDYISKVIDQVIYKGINKQLDAFINGFSKCFPYKNLSILTPRELVELFGREEEDWSADTLYSCIHAEHGYTMDSQIIHDLIDIMQGFNNIEKRQFLQFLTGSPKLPIGGFKSLKPKLTVVLKHTENNLLPDQILPSVMTCANYLKLPNYTDRALLNSRIHQAMEEGSGAFLLS